MEQLNKPQMESFLGLSVNYIVSWLDPYFCNASNNTMMPGSGLIVVHIKQYNLGLGDSDSSAGKGHVLQT